MTLMSLQVRLRRDALARERGTRVTVSIGEEFNPFAETVIDDPDPVFDRARAEEPIFFSPLMQTWVVTRYEDVTEVLRHPGIFSSEDMLGTFPFAPEVAEALGDEPLTDGAMICMDPPMHTRLRRFVQ